MDPNYSFACFCILFDMYLWVLYSFLLLPDFMIQASRCNLLSSFSILVCYLTKLEHIVLVHFIDLLMNSFGHIKSVCKLMYTGPSPQCLWLPSFVNKVLLEQNHAHLCIICSYFHLKWQKEAILSAEPRIFIIWSFTEKVYPPPPSFFRTIGP